MSFIPRSVAVSPVVVDGVTLLELPENPSNAMPLRVWINGQKAATADVAVDGDTVAVAGDWSRAYIEVDYYLSAASLMPRIAVVTAVVTTTTTLLVLPETPASGIPVRVLWNGVGVALDDVMVSGRNVTLAHPVQGEFEVEYFVQATSVPLPDGSGSGVCSWDEARIKRLEYAVFGVDTLETMVADLNAK